MGARRKSDRDFLSAFTKTLSPSTLTWKMAIRAVSEAGTADTQRSIFGREASNRYLWLLRNNVCIYSID